MLQRYAIQLSVFTRELLQAIRWRSKYNGCTTKIENKVEDYKVEGSSPSETLFIHFLFFVFAKLQESFVFTCLQTKNCFDELCTCKATSLSKIAKHVWRYSDDAGAIIENVYKFCMEEKKSGMKL